MQACKCEASNCDVVWPRATSGMSEVCSQRIDTPGVEFDVAVWATRHTIRNVTALHHPSTSTPHSELELCTVPWWCGSWTRSYWIIQMLMLPSKRRRLRVCQPLWTCRVWIYPIHAWNSAILLFLCYKTSGTDAISVLSVMKIWN